MSKTKLKEPIVLSKCCNDEVDFEGGGYIGEEIVPVYEVCKKCGCECEVKRIVPKGWKDEEIPF